jgi:hypothetical protein
MQQEQQEVIQEEPSKLSFLAQPAYRPPNPAFSTSFIPTGERSSMQFGGAEINLSPDEEIFFSILEFDNSPALFYDKDTGETFDLIPFLYDDIHSALQEMQLDMYFYEFLNEILYNYYLLDEVLYRDSGLDNLIRKIIQNDIEIPGQNFYPQPLPTLPVQIQPTTQSLFMPRPLQNPSSFIPMNQSSSPISLSSSSPRLMSPAIDYTQLIRERPMSSDDEMQSRKRVRVSGGRKTRRKLRNKKSKTQKKKLIRKRGKTIKKRKYNKP